MTAIGTTARAGSMIYVSLVVEILRARPRLVVAMIALVQALLWTLVPALFYASPPGSLALVLAFGHEFQVGSYLGPPLAFWLAELAHRAAGMAGVYALAQVCVFVTYMAVFALGRRVLGAQQAALAVLLMVGVAAFTVPTPQFGPTILAMPLWALALLHYWRAVGEGRTASFFPMGLVLGLLLLTSYWGVLLVAVLVLFTIVSARGRKALLSAGPWLTIPVSAIVVLPHLVWLNAHADLFQVSLPTLDTVQAVRGQALAWLRLAALLVLAHLGLLVLVVLASGWPRRDDAGPVVVREPLDRFAKAFVYVMAVAPVVLGTILAALLGRTSIVADVGVLLVPVGLAFVVYAGERIPVHRRSMLTGAWFALLLAPPVTTAIAVGLLPWIGVETSIARPADAMGRYFAETFERRTGRPLAVVTGDLQTAALVAVGAPSRPSLLITARPDLTPWTSMEDLRAKGAVIVWPATSTTGEPPPDIRARFPELTAELPRAFERPVQGQLPLYRVGWGIVRPQAP